MANDYRCDVCKKDGPDYYGWNDTVGYCATPECATKAREMDLADRRERFWEALESGDTFEMEEAIGDLDLFEII